MSIANIARLYDFVAGTKIQSSQVDAELNQLITFGNALNSEIAAFETSVAEDVADFKSDMSIDFNTFKTETTGSVNDYKALMAGILGAMNIGIQDTEQVQLQALLHTLVRFKTNGLKYIRLSSDGIIEYSANGTTWTSTKIGHTIKGNDGVSVTGRKNLKIVNATVTDDSANDLTVVTGLAAASHNHDSSYSAVTHNHDSAYSAATHNHNSSYSAINHNHTGVYATANHNHDSVYSAITHNHNSAYSNINHNHTGVYSAADHNHDLVYSVINHNHSGVYSPTGHTHNDLYSAIGHNHNDTYSNLVHLHDDRYSQLGHTHAAPEASQVAFTPVSESIDTITKIPGKLFLGNDGQIKQCTGSTWGNKYLNPDAYPMYPPTFLNEFEFGEYGMYQAFDVGGGVYDWSSYSPHAIAFHSSPGTPSASGIAATYLISIGSDGTVWHTFDGGTNWSQLIDYGDPPEMAFAQVLNQLQFTMGGWYYAYAPDGSGGYLWQADTVFAALYSGITFEKDFTTILTSENTQDAVLEVYTKLKAMIDALTP